MDKITNLSNRAPYVAPPAPLAQARRVVSLADVVLRAGESLSLAEKDEYKIAYDGLLNFLSRTRISESLLIGDYQANLKKVTAALFDAKGTMAELPYMGMLIALLAQRKQKTHLKKKVSLGEREARVDAAVDNFINIQGMSPNDAVSVIRGKKALLFEKSAPTETKTPQTIAPIIIPTVAKEGQVISEAIISTKGDVNEQNLMIHFPQIISEQQQTAGR